MNEEETTVQTLPLPPQEDLSEGDPASAEGETPERMLNLSGDPFPAKHNGDSAKSGTPSKDPTPCREEGDPLENLEADQLSSASLPSADPDLGAAVGARATDGLDELRGELTRLREQLETQTVLHRRLREEFREFQALYPEADMEAIPDRVWSQVEGGIPLAAAYALEARKEALASQKANQSNQSNHTRTAGGIQSSDAEHFSIEEVRAMSQSEVRKNYRNIMESMKRWN